MFQIFLDRLPEFAVFHQVVENSNDADENKFFVLGGLNQCMLFVPGPIKSCKTLQFEHCFVAFWLGLINEMAQLDFKSCSLNSCFHETILPSSARIQNCSFYYN